MELVGEMKKRVSPDACNSNRFSPGLKFLHYVNLILRNFEIHPKILG